MNIKNKQTLLKYITAIEAIYNDHLNEDYDYKNEIRCTASDLRQLAGIEQDECSECGALGRSMINGECAECCEAKESHNDIIDAQEAAYRQAKGF